MVHALEITHDVLKTGGLLIDIHPSGEPPLIEVHVGEEVQVAGQLEETNNFAEYFQADDALADVTSRGLFRLEREGRFMHILHASTIKALANFLEEEWSDSILREETIKRAAELMGEPGEDREIVLLESVRIACFHANHR
jgi:hypothetical protein